MKMFWLKLRDYIHLQDFEFTVQAALGLLGQSANSLIIFAVSEKISSSAEDDKEALPP